MKPKFVLLLLLVVFGGVVHSQIVYKISSYPDSAGVYLNGELKGYTPCDVANSWKSKEGSLKFVLRKMGYKDSEIVISEKPSSFHVEKSVALSPQYEFHLNESSAIIGFDKLVAEFSAGKVIGKHEAPAMATKEITWEGYQRIGDEEFATKTYDVLGSAGFKTTSGLAGKLFSDQEKTRIFPRFVLGGQVKDMRIEVATAKKTGYLYETAHFVRMLVEWQVFDQATKKVVHKSETWGSHRSYSIGFVAKPGGMVEAYEMALIHFLQEGKLAEFANSAEKVASPETAVEGSPALNFSLSLPRVQSKSYASGSEMIQAATNSCVTVETDAGHGSGVIIGERGHILTAYHVIDGVNRIEVILTNGLKLEASVLSADAAHDVALLKLPGIGYQPMPVGNSKLAALGVDVFTIGTPSDIELGQSVSKGIVSGRRKFDEIVLIQTDVSVSPGNSGGPLINSGGELIGIIQKKVVGQGVEGIGFALPIESSLEVLGIRIE